MPKHEASPTQPRCLAPGVAHLVGYGATLNPWALYMYIMTLFVYYLSIIASLANWLVRCARKFLHSRVSLVFVVGGVECGKEQVSLKFAMYIYKLKTIMHGSVHAIEIWAVPFHHLFWDPIQNLRDMQMLFGYADIYEIAMSLSVVCAVTYISIMQALLQFHVATAIPSMNVLTFHLSNLIFLFWFGALLTLFTLSCSLRHQILFTVFSSIPQILMSLWVVAPMGK